MKDSYTVTGIIESVESDLGPTIRVTIRDEDGAPNPLDIDAFPFSSDVLKANIGKKITVKVEAVIEE